MDRRYSRVMTLLPRRTRAASQTEAEGGVSACFDALLSRYRVDAPPVRRTKIRFPRAIAFTLLVFLSVAAGLAGGPAAAAAAASGGAFDVERYLSIRSAAVAGLSPDMKTVAFLTNTTGSNQIWTVPAGGGWPEQVTFFSDRVSSVDWSPTGEWIAFAKDTGGDENYQLYLVTPDGSKLVTLTDDPAVRHNFGGWSKDGKWISYASNSRNKKFFDVYILNADTRERRRVLEQDALFDAGPFSNDGRKLIVERNNASLDDDLFVVDLAAPAGALAPPALLTQHEGIARHLAVGWTPDDRSIWVLGDFGREFQALGRIEISSAKLSWALEPKWDVTSAALARDGSTLALVVNEDGYDQLTVLDAATLKPNPAVKPPAGSIGGIRFSKDGRTLAMTLGGAGRNPDVWLANLATGALSRVTRSSTAGIPASSFVEPRLVRYKSFDGLEVPAFFYLPRGIETTTGLPCIVTPHGGPESQTTARFSATLQYWVGRGYAVLAPNVRGSTGYGRSRTHLDDVHKREDSVKDLAASVDWLKASGAIDPKRIAVSGGSYGGYMTLAAITLYPDLWAAAVDSYGIANFRSFFGKTASYRVGLRASEYGDPVKDAEFLDSISPLHRVDRIQAPLFVLQGANDPRVPQVEAEQIVAAIKKKGGIVEYILFPDEGHGWTKLANQITALKATSKFLDEHLKSKRDGGTR